MITSSGARGIYLEQLGRDRWTFEGEKNNFYQSEHDEMYAGIRGGKPLNNGEYMAQSTLLAIMGRMATYTPVSKLPGLRRCNPMKILHHSGTHGDAPEAPIAVPGVTRLS